MTRPSPARLRPAHARPRKAAGPPATAAEVLEPRALLSGTTPGEPLRAAGGPAGDEPAVHASGCCCPGCAAPTAGELAAAEAAAEPPAAAAYAPADTFRLHSLPGATKVIYLDFDGHTTSGTSWNSAYNGGAAFTTPAYSFEGDASFSDAELARIQRIWRRVAEDFAPFGIDVTTEDPGLEALRKSGTGDAAWGVRVVIGGSASDWYGSTAGGVAYVGSFSWGSDTPCYVFEDNLGNGDEKYTAEAASHEAGHTLGLSHDGASGTSYYQGHGSGATGWAPIMGNGYYKSLTQWSKGEYAGATQFQDDLAVITSASTGVAYRADDHGGTAGAATSVTWAGASFSASGLIERNTDFDYFAFDVSAAGTLTLDVSPFELSPNLDVLAELYDASGALVASSNPLTSLGATFSLFVSAGRYYLKIDGTGKAASGTDPGYSDYGSLGTYTVSASMAATSPPVMTVTASAASLAENAAGGIAFTFTRTGDLSQALTVRFSVGGTAQFGTDYAVTGAASFSSTDGTVTFAAGSSTAVVTVDPTADSTVELDETVLLTLLDDPAYAAGAAAAAGATVADDDAATVSVADASVVEGDGGVRTLVFTVTLDRAVDSSVSLSYATADGTATAAGGDYAAATGTLVFSAGQTSKTVSVTVNGDTEVEPDELFELVLSGLAASGRAVTIGRDRATGTIENDDAVPPPPAGVAAGEDRTDAVRVTWQAAAGATSYQVWRGTTDLPPAAALATGVAGTEYLDASAVPGVRYFYWVRAFNAAGASGFGLADAGGVLPVVTVSASPASLAEDAPGGIAFTLTRTGDVSQPLTVGFGVGGSAALDADYTATGAATFSAAGGTISFAAGSGTATVFVDPTADGVVELDESVTLTLAAGSDYAAAAAAAATGTITNDDISNAAPTAADDSAAVAESGRVRIAVLANDADPDGDALRLAAVNGAAVSAGSVVTLASGAKVSVESDGGLVYDPKGKFRRLRIGEAAADSFTYAVSDGRGGTATATVLVTVRGDGGADLIGYDAGSWFVGRSTGSSFESASWARWSDAAWDALRQADVDGDGRTDVVGLLRGRWYVGLSTGTGFATAVWAAWANVAWADVNVRDVDGDGRADLLARRGGKWWVGLSAGAAFAAPSVWAVWSNTAWESVALRDVTGDGRADLIGASDGVWYVGASAGGRFAGPTRWGRWAESGWEAVGLADVDGDGRADLYGFSGGVWTVGRSTGGSFAFAAAARWSGKVAWSDASVADVDGDGRDDFVARTGGDWWVGLSAGLSAGAASRWASWANLSWRDVRLADFDGDGRADLAARIGRRWFVGVSSAAGFGAAAWGTWPDADWTAVAAGLAAGPSRAAAGRAGAPSTPAAAAGSAVMSPTCEAAGASPEPALAWFWVRSRDEGLLDELLSRTG